MHDIYIVIAANGDVTWQLDPGAARAATAAAKIRVNTLSPSGKIGTITGTTGNYGFTVTPITAQGNKHSDNF